MSVIIIGSGISGTAAAAELTKNGIDVVMLEAQDRTGGRTYTVESNGRKYDLGASWMHETLVNPLFKQAVKLGIRMTYDDGADGFYTRNGPLDPADRIPSVANDILNQISVDYMQGKYRRPDTSIKNYATEFVNEWPLITPKQKHFAPRVIQRMELWNAISWEELPASCITVDCLGRNAYVIDGYSSVYNWVYEQIDQTHFELHKSAPVTSVAKTETGFEVKTSGRSFSAEHVICTIPMGALSTELFDLELPEPLAHAIDTGSMGSLGKFFLEFEEEFWPHENDRFHYITDLDPSVEAPMEPGNHPLEFTCSMKDYPGPPVLNVQTAPPLTQYLEANPDKVFEFFKPALEAIKKKGATVPKPTKIIGTDWSQNPYFRGTYSAIKVGEDYDSTVQPFMDGAGRLRFAGEHTDLDGCVHGAYASGVREALNVLDELKEGEE